MINLTLNFDTSNKAENPTCILTSKGGQKIGLLTNIKDVVFKNSCENAPEMAFKVYKNDGDTLTPFWNEINMYKLIYVLEMDCYFAIECDTSEDENGVYKSLTLTRLAEAELNLIKVYGLQINTEAAIILPDYDANFPVVLYHDLTDLEKYDDIWNSDPKYTKPTEEETIAYRTQILRDSSLLHKILSYTPHYTIGHVDESIMDIQRIFEFNSTSIMECLKNIAEEESIVIDFDCGATHNRIVNAYDALTSCNVCGYRGRFTGVCPECGSSDLNEGFGANTGILVSRESLGNNLTITRNSEAICNCYHVMGGDDLMTAAIRQCNPNGGYVWSFSDEMKEEMSDGLKAALNAYESLYNDYQNTHVFDMSLLPYGYYNYIVNKYRALDPSITIEPVNSITGYSELIEAYYGALDMGEYLNHSLMPSVENDSTTAAQIVAELTEEALSPVAVYNIDTLTLAQASAAVVNYAKIKSDPLYDIQVIYQGLSRSNNVYTWYGRLSVTNYYDKSDTAVTNTLYITINQDIYNYAQNSVMQTLLNRSQGNTSIENLYNVGSSDFYNVLKYYSYQMLQSIGDCFAKALEMLVSIGADNWSSDAYMIYTQIQSKIGILQSALGERESEVKAVDFKDSTTSMVAKLWEMITNTIAIMKLENNLTPEQWVELNAFRREADFSNDNYISTSFRKKFDYTDSTFISDSLSNSELIKRAYEFVLQAEYKIKENNKYSYNISTNLQNLLVIDEFSALRDNFQVGNWIRIMDSNGTLYKLRLIDYEVDFENLDTINVNFADISLDNGVVNRMRKSMAKTLDVVNNFYKANNQGQSNLVQRSDNISNDYAYSDSYSQGMVNGTVSTTFNVLDGLIEGKISAEQALSLIAQELDRITLTVQNGDRASTITIKYNGIDISTTGNITLGGTVVFEGDLTDGETVISGDNIMTGEIKSANYRFTTGQYFSDEGSLFNLINGLIRTPAIYSDGTTGELRIKGTIYADAGYVGGYPIITADDNSYALDHAHNAWKLRSAPIAGQNGKRYYVSLTRSRNLLASDSKDDGHSSTNDQTGECNIGSHKYPWKFGYFKRVYMDNVLLGTEYVKIALEPSDWDNEQCQVVDVVGITKDNDEGTNEKQCLYITPAYSSAVDYYNSGIVCIKKAKNKLKFKYLGDAPSETINVFVYASNAKPKQDTLDAPYNLAVNYDEDEQVTTVQWDDPADELFALWDKTIVVRKAGSPAESYYEGDEFITDGTILTEYSGESNRDKYKSIPFVDETIKFEPQGKYYYTVYAVTSEYKMSSDMDAINTGDAPYIDSIIMEDSMGNVNYTLFPGFYNDLKIVYKLGSEPVDADDGELVYRQRNFTIQSYNSQIAEISGIPVGNVFVKIFALVDDTPKESNLYIISRSGSYDFYYTGTVQTWVVPVSGIYQLEVWGAQGGSDDTYAGGFGGYSTGEVDLQEGDVLYIAVGGQNGYNGGGNYTPD